MLGVQPAVIGSAQGAEGSAFDHGLSPLGPQECGVVAIDNGDPLTALK